MPRLNAESRAAMRQLRTPQLRRRATPFCRADTLLRFTPQLQMPVMLSSPPASRQPLPCFIFATPDLPALRFFAEPLRRSRISSIEIRSFFFATIIAFCHAFTPLGHCRHD